MRTTIFTLAALLAACSTHAQTVYRCGNTYSQQACEGGTAVKVEETQGTRDAATRAAETKRDAKAADAMEKARLQQEAKAAPASVMQHTKSETATAPSPRPAEIQPGSHAKKQGAKPAHFTAMAPKKPQPPVEKKKAAGKKPAAKTSA